MAFTDIVFGVSRAQGVWEIPPGTAPSAPVASGVSMLAALQALYAKVDVVLSTRLAGGSYVAPDSAATIAAAVDAPSAATIAAAVAAPNAATIATAVWNKTLP